MKDNATRNIIALAVIISVGGAISYYATNQDTPLVEDYSPLQNFKNKHGIVDVDEPVSEDLPVLTEVVAEPEQESLASKYDGIDLGEETILPEIEGYEVTGVDELPSLTLDGSHLIDVEPVELTTVDDMPSLES